MRKHNFTAMRKVMILQIMAINKKKLETQYGYTSNRHSELYDDDVVYQEENDQKGITVRDDTTDNKNEDTEQLDKDKIQIHTSDQYEPVDRDEETV